MPAPKFITAVTVTYANGDVETYTGHGNAHVIGNGVPLSDRGLRACQEPMDWQELHVQLNLDTPIDTKTADTKHTDKDT